VLLTVPRSWAEVTPAWVGAAMGRPVAGLGFEDVANGTNSRARITVRFADDDECLALFVKREGRVLNRLALTALGAREAEADLARYGVELPVEHPEFYAGAVDRRRLAAVVVMEDVTGRGARPNSAVRPLTLDQVASGLRELAALHAAYWRRPLPGFVRPWRVGRPWAAVAWAGLVHARRKLRRLGQPLDVELVDVEHGFRGWAALARRGPQTLLHGDPHPGNTYATDTGTGFYDWQLVRAGCWVHDVGYFIVSSLTVADRRAHERDLLDGYLDALSRRTGDPPRHVWPQYCATPVYGLGAWLQTIAAGTFQPVDTCLVTIERFAAAYRDLH
jgi:Phosphotransferase enzyme family